MKENTLMKSFTNFGALAVASIVFGGYAMSGSETPETDAARLTGVCECGGCDAGCGCCSGEVCVCKDCMCQGGLCGLSSISDNAVAVCERGCCEADSKKSSLETALIAAAAETLDATAGCSCGECEAGCDCCTGGPCLCVDCASESKTQ